MLRNLKKGDLIRFEKVFELSHESCFGSNCELCDQRPCPVKTIHGDAVGILLDHDEVHFGHLASDEEFLVLMDGEIRTVSNPMWWEKVEDES